MAKALPKSVELTPPPALSEYTELVKSLVPADLRPPVVLALIWELSRADKWKIETETHLAHFYDPPAKKSLYSSRRTLEENRSLARQYLGETEFTSQSSRWGLMQVYGSHAREMGLKGSLPQLCEPAINLRYGIKRLWEVFYESGNVSTDMALAKWGGSREFARSVIDKMAVLG